MKTCVADECAEQARYRSGHCSVHYARLRSHGSLDARQRMDVKRPAGPCTIDGCDRPGKGQPSICPMHSARIRRRGTPDAPPSRAKTCTVEGCARKHCALGYCQIHRDRFIRNGDPGPAEIRDKPPLAAPGTRRTDKRHGYVMLKMDHPRAGRGWVREHIVVMEQKLGRALLPGEEVHHRNGVKDDNRPENLEVWAVRQPKGQRPADLLEWAHEIISRYENDPAVLNG